jgi:hypothetical protein
MKKLFPVLIVDDFLENPDKIREIALSMEYYPNDGKFPGTRTKSLNEINVELHSYFANKIFSAYFDFNSCELEWVINISFQLTHPYDEEKNSPFNNGWIHTDPQLLAGVLYLTPEADINSGTCIFQVKNRELEQSLLTNNQESKFDLYKKNIKSKGYKSNINNFNDNFVETITVKNLYNRLIAFDGSNWHAAQSLHAGDLPRLTAVFFVESLKSTSEPPITRINHFLYE